MTAKDASKDPFAGLGTDQALFNSPKPKLKKSSIRRNERSNERTKKRTNVRTKSRVKQIKSQRIKIRHTFDIYQDQLVSMQAIQLEAFKKGLKKPRLGDLVQKALDSYFKKNKK